ncbi:MAG: hypothetical protein K2J80_07325 [Oscillospiraceae bacterium]|nr:hypothetical protein [Oscillospiraceae bacterium]
MNKIVIDEAKLPEVMDIIEAAAELMDKRDYNSDAVIRSKLEEYQKRLIAVIGNDKLEIEAFREYWGWTSLETVARKALMPPPEKTELTDEQIKEIVINIMSFKEEEMDWHLEYLKINTGLDNLTDYIFYPDLVGLDRNADLEQIADKIIADRK